MIVEQQVIEQQHVAEQKVIEQHVQEGSLTNVPDQDRRDSYQTAVAMPRINQKVKYLPANHSNWKVGEIISRAGKATGKYKHWWNIRNEDDIAESID